MLFASVAVSTVLAACSSSSENSMTFFVSPGKYQYHNCDQLATATKSVATYQKGLKALLDKAEQGAAGAFVGTIAYKSDYLAATEDLRAIESAAREKNCLTSETWRSNIVIR
jgi:major membrane immunogen (membrane-anchored lipoprotein)